MEITAAYPAGIIGDTPINLKAAADGEKMEWSEIFADFEKTAREEGFEGIATSFKEIAEVEGGDRCQERMRQERNQSLLPAVVCRSGTGGRTS